MRRLFFASICWKTGVDQNGKQDKLSLVRVRCPHCSSPYDIEKQDLYKTALCEDCGRIFVAGTEKIARPVKSCTENTKPLIQQIHDASPAPRPAFVRPIISIKSGSEQVRCQESLTQGQSATVVKSCSGKTSPVVWYAVGALAVIMVVAIITLSVSHLTLNKYYQASAERIGNVEKESKRAEERVAEGVNEKILANVNAIVKESIKLQTLQLEAQSENVQTNFADIRRILDSVRERLALVEKSVLSTPQTQTSISAERYDDLLKRIEELSKQAGGLAAQQVSLAARTASLAERQISSRQIGDAAKSNSDAAAGQQQESRASEPSKMSQAELAQRLKANLAEINRLIASNPGCVLVPSDRQARILETKLSTKGQRRYCLKDKITYVREDYRCTHCNSEISLEDANEACCEVSAKRSFALWRGMRLDADKTAKINARIDELRRENTVIRSGGQPIADNHDTEKQQLDGQAKVDLDVTSVPDTKRDTSSDSDDLRKKSVDELAGRYKANLAEIKRLRETNPGCMLVPSHEQTRILETRFATKNQQWYCNKAQITYVRDMFRCTHCKKEFGITSAIAKSGCCEVSRKQSFKKWSKGVEDAQKTAEINERIEALFKENAELKKVAQQQSH